MSWLIMISGDEYGKLEFQCAIKRGKHNSVDFSTIDGKHRGTMIGIAFTVAVTAGEHSIFYDKTLRHPTLLLDMPSHLKPIADSNYKERLEAMDVFAITNITIADPLPSISIIIEGLPPF